MGIPRVVVTIALLGAVGAVLAAPLQPVAPERPVTEDHFGVRITDPYRYMENVKDPQVMKYLRAQAAYANQVLAHIPGRDQLLAALQKISAASPPRILSVMREGDHLYYLKRGPSDPSAKLFVRDEAGHERLLLDPERLPKGSAKHNAIDYFLPAADNRAVIVAVSPGGSEQSVLHVVNVATGKLMSESIDRTEGAQPSWMPDNTAFLYTRLQKLAANAPVTDKYKNSLVYLHTLGTDPAHDVAVFGNGIVAGIEFDPAYAPNLIVYPHSQVVLARVNSSVADESIYYVSDVSHLLPGRAQWKKVADIADGVTSLLPVGDQLYAVSFKDAPKSRILTTPLAAPDLAHATVLVAEGDAVLKEAVLAKDAVYVAELERGYSAILRVPTDGSAPATIALPFAGAVDDLWATEDVAGLTYAATTWTRLGGHYAYDPARGISTSLDLVPVGPFDAPADLVADEVSAQAADGVSIPLTILHKKDMPLDGTSPTVLYGYGAYGISLLPGFSPRHLPWYALGGTLALCHVRGGGELGEAWHSAGKLATKPNTWRDGIACANYLLEHHYTTPERLAIRGGSAGGIFVGRAITERPDLFAVAIDEVPSSDTLRMEFGANGATNLPEFGSIANEAGFKALLAMSPLANVRDHTPYPAVLLTTGINDPRVDVWEVAKMAARLQAATSSGRPILLRVDFDAGHGIGSTRQQADQEEADAMAFTLWQFRLPAYQPAP